MLEEHLTLTSSKVIRYALGQSALFKSKSLIRDPIIIEYARIKANLIKANEC